MPKPLIRRLSGLATIVATVALACGTARGEEPPVTLDAGRVTLLDNGTVRLGVYTNGELRLLSFDHGPNLATVGAWSADAGGYRGTNREVTATVNLGGTYRVIRQSADLIELAYDRAAAAPLWFATSLHYMLRRGDPGFYLFMTAARDTRTPPGYIARYGYTLRLHTDLFNYIAVDNERRGISHSSNDERKAPLVDDVARRLPGGRVVSPYDTCHDLEDDNFRAYGWAGSDAGVWLLQASGDYYGSAPFHRLMTAHQTAAGPVVEWQAHDTLRGGTAIDFPPGDATPWTKVYGPVFVYMNGGMNNNAKWADASERAKTEVAQWPYRWMQQDAYPLDRSLVTGRLLFEDGTAAVGAYVILTPPGTDWSVENRGYRFWTRTDRNGSFLIPSVRPGTYALTAVGADQFEEFHFPNRVVAGDRDMGTIRWQRVTHGERLWQVGTVDRSPGEFHGGNDFHHWGNWRSYPAQFPADVTFTIGQSTERNDWNYVQWNWYNRRNAWQIVFDLPSYPTGRATLTFGICMARGQGNNGLAAQLPATVQVFVNAREIAPLLVEPTDDDMAHSARQNTVYRVVRLEFEAGLLRRGTNVIRLCHAMSRPYHEGDAVGETGPGPGGIAYDAIRLEVAEKPVSSEQ